MSPQEIQSELKLVQEFLSDSALYPDPLWDAVKRLAGVVEALAKEVA